MFSAKQHDLTDDIWHHSKTLCDLTVLFFSSTEDRSPIPLLRPLFAVSDPGEAPGWPGPSPPPPLLGSLSNYDDDHNDDFKKQ